MDKHIASHGTTDDGYLFKGRRHKHVTRRTYNEDFERATAKAGLPPEFIPHTLRHCFASISLAHDIPITEVSRWLGHKSIEVTHQICTSCPAPGTAPAPSFELGEQFLELVTAQRKTGQEL
jgi:site-specific recombinase XerD